MSKVTLHPYQQKGLNGVFEAMREGFTKILLVLAMGLGKTTLMGRIIQMGFHKDNTRSRKKELSNACTG